MEIEFVLASYPALVGGRRPRWLGHTLRDRTRRRSPRVPLHSFSSFCRFGVVSMAATPPWWRAANSNISRAAMEAAYDKFFDTSSDESTPPSSPDVTSDLRKHRGRRRPRLAFPRGCKACGRRRARTSSSRAPRRTAAAPSPFSGARPTSGMPDGAATFCGPLRSRENVYQGALAEAAI